MTTALLILAAVCLWLVGTVVLIACIPDPMAWPACLAWPLIAAAAVAVTAGTLVRSSANSLRSSRRNAP